MINKRILSTLLALAILLSCVGWTPAQAQEAASVEENIDTAAQLADNSNISQFVDMEQFTQADHVARLCDEEKLNTYVFRNRDGSKSVYYMDQDVKFVDDGGTIREKDTTLVRGEKGYGVRSNDVGLHIPDSAVDGITVSHNSRDVKLIPNGGSGNAAVHDNSVVYSDFFGRGIHLKYTPMLSGVKEDVIITKYTGVNSFSFTLETGGLYLYETDGQYYLAANEDAEGAFYLGEVLVYDAIGRPDLGTMTVETITAGQRYKLTVSANEAFLTDAETLYPVTIDPTLTVSDNTHGAGAIEDAPVFSGKPTKNFGSYVYNTIGYHSESYGTAMTVVRLAGLLADETYSALSVSDISNVTFYMKDGGSSSATVNIHAISSNSTWTESGVTYENLGSYSTTVTATDTMGSGSWGEFDITTLAKGWKSTAVNGQCGFVMVIGDSTKKVGTLSSEYSNTDYRPYVVATYTVPSPDVLPSGVYMIYSQHFGTTRPKMMDTTGGDKGYSLSGDEIQTWSTTASEVVGTRSKRAQLYKITRLSSGYYTIRPMTNSALGFAVSGSRVMVMDGIGTNDDNNVSLAYLWKIYYDAAVGCTFQNLYTGKYISISSTGADGAAVGLVDDSSDGKAWWKILKYTGSTDSMRNFLFNLNGSHIVPMAGTFNVADILNNCFFYSYVIGENALPVTLSALDYSGQTSTVAYISGTSLIGYEDKAGMVNLKIQFGSGTSQIVKYLGVYFQPQNSTYFYLQNVRLSNGLQYGFVQPHVTNTNVIKAEATFSPEQVWQLESYGSNTGYYLIKNISTEQYLTSPATTVVDTIVYMSDLLPYVTSGTSTHPNARQLWKIEPAPSGSGAERLRSKYMVDSGVNLCLAVRESDNVLLQGDYINNNSYLDEFNVLFFGNEVVYQRAHPYDSVDFHEDQHESTLNYLSKWYDDFLLVHKTVPITYDMAISLARNSKITVFCGHATATSFLVGYYNMFPLRTGSVLQRGILYNTDLYSNGTVKADFSDVDIIIFAGCEAAGAVASGYNLAESANLAGAKVVIGWETQTGSELFDWMEYFFKALNDGETVELAKIYADGKMSYSSSKTSKIYGDASYTFN